MTQEKEKHQQSPCPICGGQQFAWGDYVDAGFKPDGSRAMADWMKERARYCEKCGNLQIFTEWDGKTVRYFWENPKDTPNLS